ncbi:hypothetical protein FJY69_09505 [candidate division WOR-3 bacterium]|nr:hypothetical protein [candidate division WOR-3 bacterium]
MTSAKLLLALLAVGLTAGAGVAQPYVEDSVLVDGGAVSLIYSDVTNYEMVYGCCEQPGVIFAIEAISNIPLFVTHAPAPYDITFNPLHGKVYATFAHDSLLVISAWNRWPVGRLRTPGATKSPGPCGYPLTPVHSTTAPLRTSSTAPVLTRTTYRSSPETGYAF